MKKYVSLAFTAIGICCGIGLPDTNFHRAHAQNAVGPCNLECALKRVDVLDRRVNALEQAVDTLATENNKSIKSGQRIALHTDSGHAGGCLTYVGPSGDLGGFVSWNVNCSRGTSWVINLNGTANVKSMEDQ